MHRQFAQALQSVASGEQTNDAQLHVDQPNIFILAHTHTHAHRNRETERNREGERVEKHSHIVCHVIAIHNDTDLSAFYCTDIVQIYTIYTKTAFAIEQQKHTQNTCKTIQFK